MPIGTITMVLANVGLQIYNNWCGSRQNEQLRQKREEFEQAALERNTQRMWQIMREGQALTQDLEEQKHQQRLKDLQGEVDNLLHSIAYSATIKNWPLNVLPIVMKNQALGNLLAQQEEAIALHCILTPSNSYSFNTSVFPLIEEALETYCNQHWNIASDHPILFYSGAWKSNTHPTEVQIASMRTALSNLPTLLITPEFRPTDGKLVFQVRTWGVGTSSSDEFSIPEIEPTKFQRDYTSSLDYAHDSELASEVFEDLVPYLQCLIGYMTDTYFWSSLGKSPVLPRLLTDGSINTDGMKYLVKEYKESYDSLYGAFNKHRKKNTFSKNHIFNLAEGCIFLLNDKKEQTKLLEKTFFSLCSFDFEYHIQKWDDIWTCIEDKNVDFEDYSFVFLKNISLLRNLGNNVGASSDRLNKIYSKLNKISKEQLEFFQVDNINLNSIVDFARHKKDEAINPLYYVFIIWNSQILIGTFCSESMTTCIYSRGQTARYFVIRQQLASGDNVSYSVDNWNGWYYIINLQNNKTSKMKKENFETQFGKSFERIGKGLGRIVDGFNSEKEQVTNDLWGDTIDCKTCESGIDKIVSYFIANAGKSIPAERVENMEMKKVLDWVDNNVVPFADKVYIVKGLNAKYKKHVFCVFFGAGGKILLKDENPRICFITSEYNEEMANTFGNNEICEIPLK